MLSAVTGRVPGPNRAHSSRGAYALYETDDASVHSLSATDWSHSFEQVQPGRFLGTTAEAFLGSMQFAYERVEGSFRYCGRSWHGSRFFQLILPESGDLHSDGRLVPTSCVVTNRWDEFGRVTCSRRVEAFMVTVDEESLRQYAETSGRSIGMNGHSGPNICNRDPVLVRGFKDTVAGILRAIALDPSFAESEKSCNEMRESVLRLLCDLMSTGAEPTTAPPPSTRAYIVDKATALIDSKLADQLSVSELCGAIRCSERTLRYSFEQVLGITPVEYIRAARLNRVRRELASGCHTTIESAAVRWGFWHMGRFARYYRQAFGENPASTVRTAPQSRGTARRAMVAPAPAIGRSSMPWERLLS